MNDEVKVASDDLESVGVVKSEGERESVGGDGMGWDGDGGRKKERARSRVSDKTHTNKKQVPTDRPPKTSRNMIRKLRLTRVQNTKSNQRARNTRLNQPCH